MFSHRKITPFITTFALAALLLVSGCGADSKAKIDTTDGVTNILDYVSVDFSGKNGEGTATVSVDYDGIETEMVGGEAKIKELSDVDDLAELTKYINAVSSISFSIDKTHFVHLVDSEMLYFFIRRIVSNQIIILVTPDKCPR